MEIDENQYYVFQPEDIRRILDIKNDYEYDLILKSWRFLFDFMYAAKDGTQMVSNLIRWTKCGSHYVNISEGDRQLEIEFNTDIEEEDLFDEIFGLIEETKIIKLPTL